MNFSSCEDVDVEAALDTLAVMSRQEVETYVTQDWSCHLHQQQEARSPRGPLHRHEAAVDVECRTKMAQWCTQVVDFCKFSHETVEISMSHLDRYLNTAAGVAARNDRSLYQLASMASLYTAVKVNEPEAMDPKLVSNLSRGTYSPQQVESAEFAILMALRWRVNPPTTLSFARQFLKLVPSELMDDDMRRTAYDLTKFQAELALADHRFMTVRRAVIAFSAFMNSLESLGLDDQALEYMGGVLSQSVAIDRNDQNVLEVQSYLFQLVLNQPVDGHKLLFTSHKTPSSVAKRCTRHTSCENSPVSVSATR